MKVQRVVLIILPVKAAVRSLAVVGLVVCSPHRMIVHAAEQ